MPNTNTYTCMYVTLNLVAFKTDTLYLIAFITRPHMNLFVKIEMKLIHPDQSSLWWKFCKRNCQKTPIYFSFSDTVLSLWERKKVGLTSWKYICCECMCLAVHGTVGFHWPTIDLKQMQSVESSNLLVSMNIDQINNCMYKNLSNIHQFQ